jgi:hypothetical protein
VVELFETVRAENRLDTNHITGKHKGTDMGKHPRVRPLWCGKIMFFGDDCVPSQIHAQPAEKNRHSWKIYFRLVGQTG